MANVLLAYDLKACVRKSSQLLVLLHLKPVGGVGIN